QPWRLPNLAMLQRGVRILSRQLPSDPSSTYGDSVKLLLSGMPLPNDLGQLEVKEGSDTSLSCLRSFRVVPPSLPVPTILNGDSIAADGTCPAVEPLPAARVQTLSIVFPGGGAPTGGSFTLRFSGQQQTQTTTPLPFNATADQLQTALEALP